MKERHVETNPFPREFPEGKRCDRVAIKVSFLVYAAEAQLIQTPPRPGADWLHNDGKPKYRLDAIVKVTGERHSRAIIVPAISRDGRKKLRSPIRSPYEIVLLLSLFNIGELAPRLQKGKIRR